jgi:hypothetical protein
MPRIGGKRRERSVPATDMSALSTKDHPVTNFFNLLIRMTLEAALYLYSLGFVIADRAD